MKKLPSIREDEEGGDDDPSSVCRAPRSPLRLSRGLSSPVRSPLLPPRPFRAPAEHGRPATLQIPVLSFSGAPPELSPRLTPREKTYVHAHLGLIFTRLHRPDLLCELLFICLRRFVDGIEAETSSTSSQKFEFSPSLSPAAPSSPQPGTTDSLVVLQSDTSESG